MNPRTCACGYADKFDSDSFRLCAVKHQKLIRNTMSYA